MPNKDPMTWRASTKRWSKQYRGQHYSVSHRQLVKVGLLSPDAAATKDGTRAAMRKWWKTKKAEIDAAAQAALRRQPTGIRLGGVGVDFEADGEAHEILKIDFSPTMSVPDQDAAEQYIGGLITKGERLLARLDDNTPAERTIQANVSAFVSFKRSQAEAGERSLDRADSLRVHLNEHFAKWIAPETPVTDINEATVSDYYQHILSLAKEGKVSRYYARDLFASFRQFVRWVANRRLIPLPLNLASRDFGFKLTGNIQTFENAEVTALLNAASGRTKLYLLLMLNCGFTQADIAELGQSEIDLKRGTLAHKRTKTEEHESVPTVAYGLWKETKALLVEYLNRTCKATNRHGDCLALVNENGNGLLRKRYDEKGKLKKQDDIRSAYNRVVAKLNRKRKAGDRINKTLKHFRKTASSKLEEHPTYGRYVVHFLGQSPESVAGKFYVSPSQKQFDEAVKWLRGQFTF